MAAEVLQAVDLAVAVAVAGKEVKVSGTANAVGANRNVVKPSFRDENIFCKTAAYSLPLPAFIIPSTLTAKAESQFNVFVL